jgi:hypothetical protein
MRPGYIPVERFLRWFGPDSSLSEMTLDQAHEHLRTCPYAKKTIPGRVRLGHIRTKLFGKGLV